MNSLDKIYRDYGKELNECKTLQEGSIRNCQKKSKAEKVVCFQEAENRFPVNVCVSRVKKKYLRKLPLVKDSIYPWVNFDWSYVGYVDNFYNVNKTGATDEASWDAIVSFKEEDMEKAEKLYNDLVSGKINLPESVPFLGKNPNAMYKIMKGYVFDANPGKYSIPGVTDITGSQKSKSSKHIPCIKIPQFTNGKYSTKEFCPKNMSKINMFQNSQGHVNKSNETTGCKGNKICEKIVNMSDDNNKNVPYTDNFFKKKLDGKKSSSYFVRTGLCKQHKCNTKPRCQNKGYIWAQQSDKINDGICYKTQYTFIDNSSGGKISIYNPWNKKYHKLSLPDGLVPSMIVDFASLSPLNLMKLFNNKRGLGYDDMKCNNNAECFTANKKQNPNILLKIPLIIYIFILTLIYIFLKK